MSTTPGSEDFVSAVVEKVVAGIAARLDTASRQLTAIHKGIGSLRIKMSDMSQQIAELQQVTGEIRKRLDKESGAEA
jgi:predicted  nucleic acid-binding Zn-ribbon protein